MSRVYDDEMSEDEFKAKWPKYDLEGVEYWLEVSELFEEEGDNDWYERILDEETGYQSVSISDQEPEPRVQEPEPRVKEPEPRVKEPEPPVQEPELEPQCVAFCKNRKQCSRSVSKKSPVPTMCAQHGNMKVEGKL
jgi:hypothetical protein